MSRFSITIGAKVFSSKTAALNFYKNIFDKYTFGESLTDCDAKNLIALCCKEFGTPEEVEDFAKDSVESFSKGLDEKNIDRILNVMVDRHPEFRTTKCFYFIEMINGEICKNIFSYRMAINGLPTDQQIFSRACRFSVHQQIRQFKIDNFKKRPVKCAISGSTVEWEDCQVDHKAPLTFSVIIKSFIISNKLDISKIEYSYINSKETFIDQNIANKFIDFHKEMAVLRIISCQENIKRSAAARIKPTKKDGTI